MSLGGTCSSAIRMTSPKAGTASWVRQDSLCQTTVYPAIVVEPMLLDGCKALILPKLKAKYLAKYVITGATVAAIGATTYVFSTVVVSTFTNWIKHQSVIFVTVEMVLRQVR